MSCYMKAEWKDKRDGVLQVPCKGRYPLNREAKVMTAEARMKHVDDNDTILRIDDVNFPDFWLEVDIGEFINKKSIINSVVGNGNVFAGEVIFGDKPKTTSSSASSSSSRPRAASRAASFVVPVA